MQHCHVICMSGHKSDSHWKGSLQEPCLIIDPCLMSSLMSQIYATQMGTAFTSGQYQAVHCPPGQAITGIALALGPHPWAPSLTAINAVRLTCSAPTLPAALQFPLQQQQALPPGGVMSPVWGRLFPDPLPTSVPFRLMCPAGEQLQKPTQLSRIVA
jgi:hypothetical protein